MSDIPASIRAKAEADDVSALDLWLNILAVVRDAIYQRALDEGSDAVFVAWAAEEVAGSHAWIPEEDQAATAFSAMTYGSGIRLWTMGFTEEDGTPLPMSEVRKVLETDNNPRMAEIIMIWPLIPPPTGD